MADPDQCVLMPWKEARASPHLHGAPHEDRAGRGSLLKLQVVKIDHDHFLAKII